MVSFLILALTSIDFFFRLPWIFAQFWLCVDEHYFCMEHLSFLTVCLDTKYYFVFFWVWLTTNLMYIISDPLSFSFCKDGLTSKALRGKNPWWFYLKIFPYYLHMANLQLDRKTSFCIIWFRDLYFCFRFCMLSF